MLSKIESSGLTFKVWHQFGPAREGIILFRFPIDGSAEAKDGMMELLRDNKSVRPVVDDLLMLDVESGDWDRFAELPNNFTFRLGDHTWKKLPIEYVSKMVVDKELFAQ
jgi:hypothetical protein